MKTTELQLNIPSEILYTLNETKNDFIRKMKFYTALELYRLQKISTGKAAELAGMQKADFIFEAGKHNVPVINYDLDDFAQEVKSITR